ncbi:MAG: hypothetical protein K0R50_2451 [Eubacterium sp.]|jgi:hypothetical protein|nr:hypothetical protein [Eubacterium sp.]
MNIFRRNPAAITALVSLIIISIFFGGIISAKNNGSLYLQDIKGDRKVLDDVVIDGVLQDKYHGQSFSIRNGKLTQSFKFYDEASDLVESTENGSIKYIDGIQYFQLIESKPSPDANVTVDRKPWNPGKNTSGNTEYVQPENIGYIEETTKADKIDLFVTMNKSKSSVVDETIRVNTGISLKSDEKEFEYLNIYFTNNQESPQVEQVTSGSSSARIPTHGNSNNSFTYFDGKLYFTVLTDRTASGNNGIFRIDEWRTWPNWDQAATYGKVEKITDINLDKHNTDILGLENVGDKLVMYLLVDNILTFRAYAPDTGELVDELALEQAIVNEKNKIYQVYQQGKYLTVCFINKSKIVATVKFDGRFTLEHFADSLELTGAKEEVTMLDNVAAVNGKLFIFTYVTDETDNGISVNILKRRKFMLLVYDRIEASGKLLYKGEVVSDANQDTEYDRQNTANTGGYSLYDYRQFDAVNVRSK